MITRMAAVVACLALTLPVVPLEASAEKDATVVNHYEPLCYMREREARGIPVMSADPTKGYLAWYRAHWDSPEWRDWNTAASACLRGQPKFAWGALVLVGTETVP